MRRPTMDDVAARAGVSRSLVSLVMQDSPKVSAARRTAVREAAAELGYAPHTLARELASGSSSVLAVLVSDLRNPYFADVVEGVEAACESAGLQAILITGGRRPSTEERAIDTLLGFRPAGLVLLSPVVASAVLARACRGVRWQRSSGRYGWPGWTPSSTTAGPAPRWPSTTWSVWDTRRSFTSTAVAARARRCAAAVTPRRWPDTA